MSQPAAMTWKEIADRQDRIRTATYKVLCAAFNWHDERVLGRLSPERARDRELMDEVWAYRALVKRLEQEMGRTVRNADNWIAAPSNEKDALARAVRFLLEEYVPISHKEDPTHVCGAQECGGCTNDDTEPCEEYKAARRAFERLQPYLAAVDLAG